MNAKEWKRGVFTSFCWYSMPKVFIYCSHQQKCDLSNDLCMNWKFQYGTYKQCSLWKLACDWSRVWSHHLILDATLMLAHQDHTGFSWLTQPTKKIDFNWEYSLGMLELWVYCMDLNVTLWKHSLSGQCRKKQNYDITIYAKCPLHKACNFIVTQSSSLILDMSPNLWSINNIITKTQFYNNYGSPSTLG